MIESNNEQIFICVGFYTAKVKLHVNMKNFLGEKFKNWDKLIQSGTPGQHTKNRKCPSKRQLECLYNTGPYFIWLKFFYLDLTHSGFFS